MRRQPDPLYRAFVEFVLTKIDEEAKTTSRSAVARKIGVTPPTITRWLNRNRGENLALQTILRVIASLGLDLEEVAIMLSPDLFASVVKASEEHQKLIPIFLRLLAKGGDTAKALTSIILAFEQTPPK